MIRFGKTLAFATLMATLAAPVAAQDFPSRQIRIIVPWATATATDNMARLLGNTIAEKTGQTVIVLNRPGANGIVGAIEVSKSPADGYTLLMTSNAHVTNQFLIKNVGYDAAKDFTPVAVTVIVPLVVVASPSAGIRSVADLTARAKDKPGAINYGSGSASGWVGMELYKVMTGVDVVGVRYKSTTQALTDLFGGTISVMMSDVGFMVPQIEGGRVIALATTGPQRASSLPNVPTMAEAGVAGYELTGWGGVWAPAGTPAPVVERLNRLYIEAMQTPAAQDMVRKGSSITFPAGPAEVAKFQAAEIERWRKTALAAKIEPE